MEQDSHGATSTIGRRPCDKRMRRERRQNDSRICHLAIEFLEARNLLSAVSWTGAGDGVNWNNQANWSTNSVPGSDDDVTINTGTTTIQISSGTDSIHSLESTRPLNLAGGSLSIATTLEVDNTLTLAGGTLINATVVPGTAGSSIVLTSGTLNAVTLNANAAVTSGSITIVNGLTLNGTIDLGNVAGSSSGELFFLGSQSLLTTSTGSIVLGGSTNNDIYAEGTAGYQDSNVPATLTIGAGITVQGGSGTIGGYYSANDSLINQGTILEVRPGR